MVKFHSFYKTVGGGEGEKCFYPTRLDLYGKGCAFNCCYCYGKQLLDFRRLWNPSNPSVAPLIDVYRTINEIPFGSVVRLGGMTDCLQPIELKYRLTYNAIKLMNKKGIHYLIVTKSDMIANKEYLDILNPNLAHIQVSIPTNDDNILNATDNAPNFESRKDTVETLFDNGFDVSLRLSPFFYETVDYDVINDINVDKCLVEFLRVKPSLKNELKDVVTFNKYTVNEGGYRHLRLSEKLNILNKLEFKQLSVCDDVKEHYNYFKKYLNYNQNDCCNLRLKHENRKNQNN